VHVDRLKPFNAIYIHRYIYLCIHTYLFKHIHLCIYIYIYMHIYSRACRPPQAPRRQPRRGVAQSRQERRQIARDQVPRAGRPTRNRGRGRVSDGAEKHKRGTGQRRAAVAGERTQHRRCVLIASRSHDTLNTMI